MALPSKTDYSGLTGITGLTGKIAARDDNRSASTETYAPMGQNGETAAIEVFGADGSTSNAFAVKADVSVEADAIALNALTVVDGSNYALEGLDISTGAGTAPALSATSQLIEATATAAKQCLFKLPALAISTKHHAQILFAAFMLTGTGCQLTACSAHAGCTINKDKLEGVIIGSDANSGAITVSGTILQTGSTAPTIEAASGWKITGPLSCTTPEAEYKSYTFELQMPLAKTEPAS